MQPFSKYTSLVWGEDYTTISSVIPIVMKLNLQLEEMKKSLKLTNVSCLLLSKLKRRFRKYTDPSDHDFEPLFLLSTMLDPCYLNPTHAESTKKQLLKQLKDTTGNNGDSNSPSSITSTATPTQSPHEVEEPAAVKWFHHLSKLLVEKTKEGIKEVAKPPPGKQELEH